MKRNLILLVIILICAVALTFMTEQKNEGRLNTVEQGFKDYGGKELEGDKLYTRVINLRDLNLGVDDDESDIFDMYIDDILMTLDIKYENTKLPESKAQEIGDYKFFEYYLTLTCTFEKFTQFVIELEKSDKIFIIHEITLDNDDFSAREQSLDKEFEIKIRSVNLKKKEKK